MRLSGLMAPLFSHVIGAAAWNQGSVRICRYGCSGWLLQAIEVGSIQVAEHFIFEEVKQLASDLLSACIKTYVLQAVELQLSLYL